jgi:multisubunit Na+/H+ antiporter MnhC subunit
MLELSDRSAREGPAHHPTVSKRHVTVERAWVGVEDYRQEAVVARPHREIGQVGYPYPLQGALVVTAVVIAGVAVR